MADVLNELRHRCLCGVVDLEVLVERGQLIRVCVRTVEVLGELKELAQVFIGDKLPLHVEGEALLVDPTVEPGPAVGAIEGAHRDVHCEAAIILGKEYVLAGVVEVSIRDCGPVNHLRHVLLVRVVEVGPCDSEVGIGLDCGMDRFEEWAARA